MAAHIGTSAASSWMWAFILSRRRFSINEWFGLDFFGIGRPDESIESFRKSKSSSLLVSYDVCDGRFNALCKWFALAGYTNIDSRSVTISIRMLTCMNQYVWAYIMSNWVYRAYIPGHGGLEHFVGSCIGEIVRQPGNVWRHHAPTVEQRVVAKLGHNSGHGTSIKSRKGKSTPTWDMMTLQIKLGQIKP